MRSIASQSEPFFASLKTNTGKGELVNCCVVVLVILCLVSRSANAQTVDNGLQTFQKFVNGEVPIKEATVHRTLSKPDGTILNEEWWRFGYQDDTWYVERLIPDTNNPSKLVPQRMHTVCGASSTLYWTIDDKYIDSVEKEAASGSEPDSYDAPSRSLVFGALSLGLPRILDKLTIDDTRIQWNGLTFKTTVASKRDKFGHVLGTAAITGNVKLDDNGLPSSAEYPGAGQFNGGSVSYEYGPSEAKLPVAFVITFPGNVFRYEFLSLTLGTNDLTRTDGYVPALFADMTVSRTLRVWSNSLSYTLTGGKTIANYLPILTNRSEQSF